MAHRTEIVDELESLAVHCRRPIMDADQLSRWMSTWCEDLAEFPLEAIRASCKAWRQSDNTKFPTPGQLLPMVRRSLPKPPVADTVEREWTWPSEAELQGMTLRERRRQYLIMASVTRGKAGPMNGEGNHPRPRFLAQAQAYYDTAKDIADRIADAKSHPTESTHAA